MPIEAVDWIDDDPYFTTIERHCTFHRLTDSSCRVKLQMDFEPEGLVEQLADKAQIARLVVGYELGEFKAVVESGQSGS